MTFVEGLLLGAVQGVTEWLPVSSQGINSLILVNIFRLPPSEAISLLIWLHIGTLFAAVCYFRKDVGDLVRHLPSYVRNIRDFNSSPRNSLITFLIIATVVGGAIGFPLLIVGLNEIDFSGSLATAIIGFLLIVTGVVQRFAFRKTKPGDKPIGLKDGLLLGVVQAFSILPGLSRSGLTTSVLLLRQYRAEQALRLSFLMSIPAVVIANVGLGLIGEVNFSPGAIVGILTSFILGIITIGVLTRVALRIRFWMFCIFLGLLSLLPWFLGM